MFKAGNTVLAVPAPKHENFTCSMKMVVSHDQWRAKKRSLEERTII